MTEHNPDSPAHDEAAGHSLWKDALKRLMKNRAAVAGLAFIVLMSAMALGAPVLSSQVTRFTVEETNPCLRYQPPGMRGIPRVHTRTLPLDEHPFEAVDRDGDGFVTAEELSVYLRQLEFEHLDVSGTGTLTEDDLRRAPRAFPGTSDYARILAGYDRNGDGVLDIDEAELIVDIFPMSAAIFYVRQHDRTGDGRLSPDEFVGVPRPEVFRLGTDGLGRDLLTRAIWGARISLAVGLLATLVSFFIGVTWGAIAGFFGGRVDTVMMRFVDILYGLPYLFLVILLMVIFEQSILLIFIAIGAVSWLDMSRIVRGQVISLKNQEFVLAARSIGTPGLEIVFRHLIPNALGPIIVYATLTVPAVMLQEAFLSFLGLGVQPPQTSWGSLANEGAPPGVMVNYPWLILVPGSLLALTLLSLNFFGDGLRDALDPRMRKD
ncbi:MAG: ABC transporter permease subunit [Deltaproteobacteria bacterium]|nr:MAG: ABC transporter permease subunit [Deltaproteobacteria bacterium]